MKKRVSLVEPLPHLRELLGSLIDASPSYKLSTPATTKVDAWVVSAEREAESEDKPWRALGAPVVWTTNTAKSHDDLGIDSEAVLVTRPLSAADLAAALDKAFELAARSTPASRFSRALAKEMGIPDAEEAVAKQVEKALADAKVELVDQA